MDKVQIIDTPGGDRLAIVPLAEYERLQKAAEMLEDVSAYDAVKRKLAIGEEELVPQEVANRLIDGENPIRVWRDYRGLSGRALADATGISAAYLFQLEGGRRDGSFDTMRRIAEVLKVTLDDLCGTD